MTTWVLIFFMSIVWLFFLTYTATPHSTVETYNMYTTMLTTPLPSLSPNVAVNVQESTQQISPIEIKTVGGKPIFLQEPFRR